MFTLALVHLGNELPSYIYDCIYQCLILNGLSCKIFVVMDNKVMDEFKETLRKLDVQRYFKTQCLYDVEACVTAIPVKMLDNHLNTCAHWGEYIKTMSTRFAETSHFRGGFWISTTARFFYIEALMELLSLDNVFHIENDIVMYETFQNIHHTMKNIEMCDTSKIWMVQDNPSRVVPSILYFPNRETVHHMNEHITNKVLESHTFVNDMQILGQYPENMKELFSVLPEKNLLFDGAAIGQFLGGIDTRNIPNGNHAVTKYVNPSIGFINETSVFKPNTCIFSRMSVTTDIHNIPLKMLVCKPTTTNNVVNVANIHIHSKQLYRFSSIFDIDYKDIITGDRVISLCDFVIGTHEIFNFHVGLQKFAKEVIAIKDWGNIDITKLNGFFKELAVKNKTKTVKLFVYTHILDQFKNHILKELDTSLEYIIYLHNSDHPFDVSYKEIIDDCRIKHIYAQNIDYPFDTQKLSLLPIGIANSMWKHGDILSLYTVMKECYKFKKTKGIYVNINPSTYSYRKDVLDTIKKTGCWALANSKSYTDYLKELAEYRFCLCMRGNGLDTHRFWECLYLGVVPVIIANKLTNLDNFLHYLRKLNVPYITLKEDDLKLICDKYKAEYFDEDRYTKSINDTGINFYCNSSLKMTNYVVEKEF